MLSDGKEGKIDLTMGQNGPEITKGKSGHLIIVGWNYKDVVRGYKGRGVKLYLIYFIEKTFYIVSLVGRYISAMKEKHQLVLYFLDGKTTNYNIV